MPESGIPETPSLLCTSGIYAIAHTFDQSLHVPNDGPAARDHLANERNYLAWMRLALTLVMIGACRHGWGDASVEGYTVLLDLQALFDPTDTTPTQQAAARPIGYIFIAIGLFCFVSSLYTYFCAQHGLVKRDPIIGQGWVGFLMAGTVCVFAVSVFTLALAP
ncbi:hypothetical protein BC937DRAFT_90035 [Endogone sp. FLAS-F59071]|nr:hypothetical protein BC937DRAFT_90035 [Endogone sp. FLAS-F59071]|eukprot:RUS22204.1 hypothetical protein BC937DRAFT_90035 [Endogone sp. FLAS-F59071]